MRSVANSSSSVSQAKWALPERWLWAMAPPSSSAEISSPMAALMTSGPVMNILAMPLAMNTKSVSAGEYTAPPALGPTSTEICGMTPEASVFR